MESSLLYVILGLVAGVLSGVIGIGGGVIIVPVLVLLFGMSQHHAQGTTLALLIPPIGILAAWTYYKAGYVDLRVAALVAVGFFAGSFLRASDQANGIAPKENIKVAANETQRVNHTLC